MSEWKEYKLGEIATFVKEKVAVHSIATEKYISTENMLQDKGGITVASGKPEGGTVTKYYPNTILVSNIRPYFKKIWYANNEGGCSNDVLCFEAKEDVVDSKYLFFLLSQDMFFDYVMLGSKGCKMPRGDKAHIMNWDISLPSLDDQRRIASILISLDDKIDLLRRENATLEAMAETLFRQWFVVEAKEEWEEGKLGDEFVFTMGQSPSGDSFNEDGIGVPMYQGNADFGFRFPSKRVFTTQPTRFAEPNDTLISVRAPVGAQNMATEKCCIGRGVAAFRYKHNPSYYSYTYYKLKSLLEEIKQFNDNGTVFGSISKADFENLDIVIPDKETILGFQQQVKVIDDKIMNNNNEIQTLIQTRDGLLPRLMNKDIIA
jgi:type I restriction enzyme S subunit